VNGGDRLWRGRSRNRVKKGIVEECSDLQELNENGRGNGRSGGVRFEDPAGCRCDHLGYSWLESPRAPGFDPAEKPSCGLCITRSPEFLERVKSP